MSALEIIGAFAICVVAVVVLIVCMVSLGYTLLAPDAERVAIAEAKVWRQKRRELNESVVARRVR